ncbi:MAG TPA: hypothetical protein GX743_04695 [Actinomycetales bacterium]|nr:hypothetical protein [Actinomycetales bacterium]
MNEAVWSQGATGVREKAGSWSRTLGISLRPWSGQAPWSLLLRGGIQCAVSIAILVLSIRLTGAVEASAAAAEEGMLRNLAIFMAIAAAVTALLGAARAVVGLLDLAPRRTVSGTVASLEKRKFLDFLPRIAQRYIFERGPNGIDRRRERLEVVLHTPDGLQQWTVRKPSIRRQLSRGAHVRLTVTPLAGYVAEVYHQPGAAPPFP